MSILIPNHPIAKHGSARYGSSPEALVSLFERLENHVVVEPFNYECINPHGVIRGNLFQESRLNVRKWSISENIDIKSVSYDGDTIVVNKTSVKTNYYNATEVFKVLSLETNVGTHRITVNFNKDTGNLGIIFDNNTFKSIVIEFLFHRPKTRDDFCQTNGDGYVM